MITHGSCNVFADLGYADAEDRQTKLRLAHAINGAVSRLKLTRSTVAAKLHIDERSASALANYQLDNFSVERLIIVLKVASSNEGARGQVPG